MESIKFDGANAVFGAEQPEYEPLPAEIVENSKVGQINTCWELSPDELETVTKTRKIYVSLLTFGQPLQPIMVGVEKPDVYDPDEE